MLESISRLEAGKDVNAILNFFLFDQIRGKYLNVQGMSINCFKIFAYFLFFISSLLGRVKRL